MVCNSQWAQVGGFWRKEDIKKEDNEAECCVHHFLFLGTQEDYFLVCLAVKLGSAAG